MEEKQHIRSVRLNHPRGADLDTPKHGGVAKRRSLVLIIGLITLLIYLGYEACRSASSCVSLANMIEWKHGIALSTAVLGAAGQSMKVYNLSEVTWTVSNDVLNVSVPGSLPSHVVVLSRLARGMLT